MTRDRTEQVRERITAQARAVLGYPDGHVIDPTVPLLDLGLDSMMAIELRNRIQSQTGIAPPMARIITGPTVEELADFVSAALAELADNDLPAPVPQTAVESIDDGGRLGTLVLGTMIGSFLTVAAWLVSGWFG